MTLYPFRSVNRQFELPQRGFLRSLDEAVQDNRPVSGQEKNPRAIRPPQKVRLARSGFKQFQLGLDGKRARAPVQSGQISLLGAGPPSQVMEAARPHDNPAIEPAKKGDDFVMELCPKS